MSCRSRLAVLNEKLTTLERRVEYLEARVCMNNKHYHETCISTYKCVTLQLLSGILTVLVMHIYLPCSV
jgi:hypothetical protein